MFSPKSSSILYIKGVQSQFFYRVMFTFLCSIWVFLSSFFFHLLKFLSSSIWVLLSSFFFHLLKFLSRSQEVDVVNSKSCKKIGFEQDDQVKLENSMETDSSMFSEEEPSELSFRFRFQTGRDYSSFDEIGDSVLSGLAISTSNYKFISAKDVGGFIKEPQAMSFTLQELCVGSDDGLFDTNENQMKSELFVGSSDEGLFDKNENQTKSELFVGADDGLFDKNENRKKSELLVGSDDGLFDENENQMKSELFAGSDDGLFDKNENQMKSELFVGSDDGLFDKNENQMKSELFVGSDEGSFNKNENIDGKIIPSSELRENLFHDSNCFTSDDDQLVNSEAFVNQDHHKVFLDVDFAKKEETDCSAINDGADERIAEKIYSNSESSSSCGELEFHTQNILDGSAIDELGPNISISMDENIDEFFDMVLRFEESKFAFSIDKLEESDDEYIELEPSIAELGKNTHGEENELSGLGKHEDAQSSVKEEKQWDLDYDDQEDEEGNDILFEHEELIEQMKIELKNVRTGGLPTILEDCETPKMLGDLKPLKIDEKFELSDQMAEIQKFYRSYAEKMRKLDILNYQTMQAINFLQLKDPSHSVSNKSSSWANKSLLLYWPGKLRKIYADPTLKSIFELQRDLEVVYVGQICLSWEILHWQHRKVINLIEFEQGKRSYNKVAGEFQRFQVLLQRFIENEKYNGPRITNYVKGRSLVRSLLQVPPIKDDCLKDKKEKRIEEEEEYEISISMLADIIEESMRVFWDLIRADKDAANISINGIQDTADTDLLMEIKTSLQKKEKRLKDIMRSGNCIVKKFQKQGGRIFGREMLVSQVELRLISRALDMSKLSNDQLVWCQTKLKNINIANRIVHVDPSFLLFPC